MDELKEWARDAPPAWAVITGAISDLVIIDFDGETGLRTMQHLGLQPHIRTGSGGAHWYVQHPGQHVPTLSSKTKIELGREFPGLDVRGDGGYAVFYGRNLCGEYEKLRDLQPDPFTHIPSALRAALLPAQAAPPPQLVGELFPAPERVGDNILLDRALAQIGTHGRNSAGFWLAQQLRDNGYPESEAEYVLRMFAAMTPPTNSKGQREPYTTREALASLRQAYARPARDPWRRTCRPAVYRPTMAPCAAPDPTDDEVDAEPGAHAGDEQPQIRHNGAKKSNAPVESQATKLLNMTQDIELFTAPGAKPYATVMVDCHAETYPVRSAAFRMYLQHRYYKQAGTALNANALNEAIGVYTARANYEGPEQEVSIRVGHAGGKVYLDLGTRDWDAIEIDADGWRHVRQPPIKFKRSQGSLSLPYPARCPNALDLLAGMLNLAGEKDDPKRYKQQLILIIAWLTGALRGGGPYAVLNLQGEQGTAKSTTTRMLRGFVDPNEAPIRAQPQKEDELILAANNGLVLAFDNVSHIEPWLSDALCRLCTGGGFSKRQLYTDDDEVLFNVKRPLIVNGIDEVIGRSDLLDRTIPIELAKIPPDKRQLERAIWTRYADLQPVVLGLLLDGVAMALRRQDSMVFTELPRMADFAAFAAAAAPAYGWQDADVLEALEMSRKDTNASAIEASPVGRALISMMSVQNEWTGTAAHLLGQLGTYAKHNEHKLPSWPQSPRGLSGSLRRLALNLRAEGLEIIFCKSGNRSIHVRHTK